MIRSTTRALVSSALSCALALAAVALCFSSARGATLAFEALYDPSNGNISIRPYDSDTNSPWTGTAEFAVFDFNSTSGVFTGGAANFNPAPTFPPATDTDTRISTALLAGPYMTATYDAPYDVGNVAQAGLTQAFIDSDFTSGSNGSGTLGAFTYNYAGGGANKVGSVTALNPVPEPSTWALASIGLAVGGWWTMRNRRRTTAPARLAIAATTLTAVFATASTSEAATLAFEALYDPSNGNISIRPYDSDTNSPWTGTAEFAVFDFNSTSGVFTGGAANFNPAPTFPPATDTDTRISTALLAGPYMTATYDAPYDVGNVAQAGLTQAFIDTDFTSGSSGSGTLGAFTYNYAGGGANKVGTVTALNPVPEPSTIMTLAIGGIAGLGFTARRRLRRKAANASANLALAA